MNDITKACLTIIKILECETGYTICKILNGLNIQVTNQQVYKTLNKLRDEGKVKAIAVANEGKPNSIFYTTEVTLLELYNYNFKRPDYAVGLGCIPSIEKLIDDEKAKLDKLKQQRENKTGNLLPDALDVFIMFSENTILGYERIIKSFYKQTDFVERKVFELSR